MVADKILEPPALHAAAKTTGSMSQESRRHYQDFLCGWGAAVLNITTTFPINKLMFRQQLHGINIHAAVGQLHREGFANLYRGLMPPLMQKSSCLAIMFGCYGTYRTLLRENASGMPTVARKLTAAMLAGTTEAVLAPLERIQTLLQDKRYQHKLQNTAHSFSALRVYGLREYYRGVTAILLRNGPSNCFFFLIREKIKRLFPPSNVNSYIIMQDFLSGALLGSCISTLFFPVNVIKTRMQSQLGGEFLSMNKVFHTVFNERNRSWTKLFLGARINFLRSLLSWGIINASYELLQRHMFVSVDIDD